MVCETPFGMKGNGVYTAYNDSLELLREKGDVEVVVNNEGTGDVFHSHTYGPYYFWKGRKYRGRRIFTAHVIPDSGKGSLPLWKWTMPLGRWYLKKVYEYADVCIAISPMVAETLREMGVHSRIVNLTNPIPVERWKFSQEKRSEGRRMLGRREILLYWESGSSLNARGWRISWRWPRASRGSVSYGQGADPSDLSLTD
jgi:1,2-diacylglycerol-3-alpha-glucose alpha-1,2-galactosyltransferase